MIRILLVILISFLAASMAGAQVDEHHPPETPAPPPADVMPGMMPMMMMHPAMVVDADGVYVLRGNQVLRLDKMSLEVLAQTTLPMPPMQPMMPGMMARPTAPTPADPHPEMEQTMRRLEMLHGEAFDRAFLEHMIRHHSGVIVMSRVAVAKGEHPELRRFARQVIDDQTRENEQMIAWLREWHGVAADLSPMPHDERIVHHLQTLSGREFDIAFMQAMIMHHSEAVHTAGLAAERATRPELRALASQIVADQQREIEMLRGWLMEWYGVAG